MKTHHKRLFLFLLALVALAVPATAQSETVLPEVIELEASDGLTLVGDFYAVESDSAPAVLLMHMLSGRRSAWAPMLPQLMGAGYHVLNIDMRGHGDTGGDRDWPLAEADVQTWLDWLKANESVSSVSVIGASIGSNLALMGCANDPDCVTAVALSPGLDYRGVQPETAVVEGLADRSALLIAAQGDGQSVVSVRQMASGSTGDIGMRIYRGSAHGTNMFGNDAAASVITVTINWLDEHTAVDAIE